MGGHDAEVRYRWLLRIGVSLLLALSVAPAIGYLPPAAVPLLERCREILEQCALVLRSTGASLRWLPVVLLVVGLAYAVVDRMRLARKVSRVLAAHRARRVRSGEPLGRLAREFGVEQDVRVLVGFAPNPAFTAGLVRPRIYISEDLQKLLTPSELRAVFRHELSHYASMDPLRLSVLRFASRAIFWFPLIDVFAKELMDDAEIVADDFAASPRGGSDPLDVAGALVKLGRASTQLLDGTVAIGGFRLLDRRVRRLADGPRLPRLVIEPRPILLSLGMLLTLWLASGFTPSRSGAMMTMQWGDPCFHPMTSSGGHCPECKKHGEPMRDCLTQPAHALHVH